MLVKRKISAGFVILGFILLLSSLIAIYEFYNMRRTVAQLVSDDITSINTSALLLDVTDQYNFTLLASLGDSTTADLPEIPDIQRDNRFVDYVSGIRNNLSTAGEKAMADSVRYAYVAYAHLIAQAPQIWEQRVNYRRQWYFETLYPIYMQLRGYINNLILLSQQRLKTNSENLSESFYRSLMPCVVAVAIGIVLLLLFNYYLKFYFITPLEKIAKGLKLYKQTRRVYDVKLESEDEMQALNESIKDIIGENRQLLNPGGGKQRQQ